MFISYLKFKKLLCHGDQIVLHTDRNIYCETCQALVLNVTKHLTQDLDFLLSCEVAQYYANWSGDVNVPCKVKIINIPGIMPTEIIVPYSNLMHVIELLGVANQEFIVRKNKSFDKKITLKKKILENFIKQYVNMIQDLKYEDQDIQTIITAVLDQMKNMYEDKNVFEYYLNVLCPYVKTCCDFKPVEKENTDTTPGLFFQTLSQDATEIRSYFGRYCIPFDVIYLMIYCYLCHTNLDLIANFTFDLIARVCRDYFNQNHKYLESTDKILHKLISYKQNTPLHFLIQCVRKGEVVDHISQEFLEKYGELQQLVLNEFVKNVSTPTDTIQKYAFSQTFPFILFPNGPNYYGFMCMMGYLMKKIHMKSATFEKGTFANAKKILKFVEGYAQKIAIFQTEGTPVIYWNLDMLKLFIGSDNNLIEKFKDIVELLHQ